VHDVEQALFGTSLGVDLNTGKAIEGGTAITCGRSTRFARRRMKAAVEQGVLTSG
jgi:hypothetical protein